MRTAEMVKKAAQKTAKKRQSGVKTSVAPKKQKTDKRGNLKGSDEDTGEEDVDADDDTYVDDKEGHDGKEESDTGSDDDDEVPLKRLKKTVVKGKAPGLTPISKSAGAGKTSVACVSEGEEFELDDVRNSVTLTENERLCTVRTSPSMRPTFQPACRLASLS